MLVVSFTPRSLYHRERSFRHLIGGWVGPKTGLESDESLAANILRNFFACYINVSCSYMKIVLAFRQVCST